LCSVELTKLTFESYGDDSHNRGARTRNFINTYGQILACILIPLSTPNPEFYCPDPATQDSLGGPHSSVVWVRDNPSPLLSGLVLALHSGETGAEMTEKLVVKSNQIATVREEDKSRSLYYLSLFRNDQLELYTLLTFQVNAASPLFPNSIFRPICLPRVVFV
jgi:hypothetical protein